jgi:hypothetical protein
MALIGFNPFISALIALIHPFFVSVIEINHNEKEATIEISVRTFTNDLEKMMGADAKTTIDLSQANQKNKADVLIAAYITKRLNLNANGAKVNLEYIGYEIQKERYDALFLLTNPYELKIHFYPSQAFHRMNKQ